MHENHFFHSSKQENKAWELTNDWHSVLCSCLGFASLNVPLCLLHKKVFVSRHAYNKLALCKNNNTLCSCERQAHINSGFFFCVCYAKYYLLKNTEIKNKILFLFCQKTVPIFFFVFPAVQKINLVSAELMIQWYIMRLELFLPKLECL